MDHTKDNELSSSSILHANKRLLGKRDSLVNTRDVPIGSPHRMHVRYFYFYSKKHLLSKINIHFIWDYYQLSLCMKIYIFPLDLNIIGLYWGTLQCNACLIIGTFSLLNWFNYLIMNWKLISIIKRIRRYFYLYSSVDWRIMLKRAG